jgi:hypothetical protein
VSGVGHELLKFPPMSVGISWEFVHLPTHELQVVVEIKNKSVFEEVAPLRADWIEGDIVVEVLPGALEEVSKIVREGENGRSEIEGKAVLLNDIELSADLGIFFEEIDLISGSTEGNGGGKAAKATSDNSDASERH